MCTFFKIINKKIAWESNVTFRKELVACYTPLKFSVQRFLQYDFFFFFLLTHQRESGGQIPPVHHCISCQLCRSYDGCRKPFPQTFPHNIRKSASLKILCNTATSWVGRIRRFLASQFKGSFSFGRRITAHDISKIKDASQYPNWPKISQDSILLQTKQRNKDG